MASSKPKRARRRSVPDAPRLRDIADCMGVSMMTVSRALRGVEGVSETKRAEISAMADSLGYVLNSNARSLVHARSDLIGISVPTLFNDVFADMMEGMKRTFEKGGFSTVVNTSDYDCEREAAWVNQIITWSPSGIVLTGRDHTKGLKERLSRLTIPVVEIWEATEEPISISVGIDHEKAGYDLANYAVQLGYVHPGYVGPKDGADQRADSRLRGMMRCFREHLGDKKIRRSVQDVQNSFKAGAWGTRQLLEEAVPPDVIFFSNDHLAFGGISACDTMGLPVPEHVGLIGFNALDLTTVLPRPLTTMSTPRREVGTISARNLTSLIHGVAPDKVTVLETEIIEGLTTRAQF